MEEGGGEDVGEDREDQSIVVGERLAEKSCKNCRSVISSFSTSLPPPTLSPTPSPPPHTAPAKSAAAVSGPAATAAKRSSSSALMGA